VNAAVLTISDGVSNGSREDTSGDALEELLLGEGFEVTRTVVTDDTDVISAAIGRLADAGAAVVLTTGGTGFAPRDVTPEATQAVIERAAPGIAEAIRADALARTPHALLSRGIAGLRGTTLVVNLPGSPGGCRDGFAVLRMLREHRMTAPVLMLTARDSVPDRVPGLDQGADDYLTKPFAFAELLARVRVLLRRSTAQRAPVLQLADLRFDPATRRVTRGSREISLTSREYALLEYFLRNAGRVLTRPMLAEHVWGIDFDPESNVIDVYVGYLRRKVDLPGEARLVQTARGAGYVLRAEP